LWRKDKTLILNSKSVRNKTRNSESFDLPITTLDKAAVGKVVPFEYFEYQSSHREQLISNQIQRPICQGRFISYLIEFLA
jgi:hypothetical protein